MSSSLLTGSLPTGQLPLAVGVAVLAAGTYALRLAGFALRDRLTVPSWAQRLMETATVVLLAALIATTALTEGHGPAGWARPAGVVAAGLLAWRGVPFLAVVLGAAAVSGGLRLLGVA
ncbi:AzlD domain-containing protein [Streptomyces sp. NPDC059740]|uniref:AzlD domain-containing protein n=1 Tax=Streptomyces sp. NPDC059740 TaxID=3346926 RepID=UPI003649603B